MVPLVVRAHEHRSRVATARRKLCLVGHNLKTLRGAATVCDEFDRLARRAVGADGRDLDAVRAGHDAEADEGERGEVVLSINPLLADLRVGDALALDLDRDSPSAVRARGDFEGRARDRVVRLRREHAHLSGRDRLERLVGRHLVSARRERLVRLRSGRARLRRVRTIRIGLLVRHGDGPTLDDRAAACARVRAAEE